MQFGLYYTEFNLGEGENLIENIVSSSFNKLDWNGETPPDVNGIKDGTGQYIIDPEFLLFSTQECCNNYVQQLNNEYIKIKSQFDSTNEKQWVYGSKANPDLFKINYNSPVYFKAGKIGEGC